MGSLGSLFGVSPNLPHTSMLGGGQKHMWNHLMLAPAI